MVLSSIELSKKIKDSIKTTINCLRTEGRRRPGLVTILVGDNPASKVYVANKEKACEEVGLFNDIVTLPEHTTEEELLYIINYYNNNIAIDGILVQLPLPTHIDTKKVIDAINPNKDVDGFHSENVAKLWLGEDGIVPCTPKGVMELFGHAEIDLKGKNVVVLGRSNIVGLPVAKLCLDRNATVTICHSKTENLKEITKQADVLIVAIGKPKFVTEDMVKDGVVVIDVGINRVDGKLCGDVDFDNVKSKASFITPVPRGVGPMTITCLLYNTMKCYFNNESNSESR